MGRLGIEEDSVKQAAGSLLGKASRFKFEARDDDGSPPNRVLEMESMLMGIEGKAALWRKLKQLAGSERRLADIDFDHLGERASQQQANVERHRQELVPSAFAWRWA